MKLKMQYYRTLAEVYSVLTGCVWVHLLTRRSHPPSLLKVRYAARAVDRPLRRRCQLLRVRIGLAT